MENREYNNNNSERHIYRALLRTAIVYGLSSKRETVYENEAAGASPAREAESKKCMNSINGI